MPIHINKNNKKKTISKNPSYKGGKLLRIKSMTASKGDKFYIKTPVIDKITLLGGKDLSQEEQDIFEWRLREGIKKNRDLIQSHEFKDPKDKEVSRYRCHYKIFPDPESERHIMLSYGPYNYNNRYFKLEFNPAKLGKSGVQFLKNWFDNTFEQSFEKIISLPKCIGKIHIAIDIVGIDVADLILNFDEDGKSNRWHAQEGLLETYYTDAKEKTASKLKIYKKKRDTKNLEEDEGPDDTIYTTGEEAEDSKDEGECQHSDERSGEWATPQAFHSKTAELSAKRITPVTRIEKEIQTDRSLKHLYKLKPHFKDVKILLPLKLNDDQVPEGQHHWQLFLDSVRWRGYDSALNLLPQHLRFEYKRAFESCVKNVFEDPYNKVLEWEALIQKAVKDSHLLDV